MRTVLDTNIVVLALLFGGRPQELLDLGESGECGLYTSNVMLDELDGVRRRTKFAEWIVTRDSELLVMHPLRGMRILRSVEALGHILGTTGN